MQREVAPLFLILEPLPNIPGTTDSHRMDGLSAEATHKVELFACGGG